MKISFKNLSDVQRYAKGLIRKHLSTYHFEFSRTRKTCGDHCAGLRRIRLSRTFCEAYLPDPKRIDEVLKHEVAHAISFHKYGSFGHNKIFRMVCRQLGCCPDGKFTIQVGDKIPGAKYALYHKKELFRVFYKYPTSLVDSLDKFHGKNKKEKDLGDFRLEIVPKDRCLIYK